MVCINSRVKEYSLGTCRIDLDDESWSTPTLVPQPIRPQSGVPD